MLRNQLKESVKGAAESTKESVKGAAESAKESVKGAAESAKSAMESAKESTLNAVESVKQNVDKLAENITTPQESLPTQTDAHELKSNLEWGRPGFSILDVRDRQTYNQGHIMGAMSMPSEGLADRAVSSLAKSRDIYVYGESNEQSAQAAQSLKSAGFERVSELKGGLAAWKEIGGPTEGIVESQTPAGADDYNVVARMQNHAETQQKKV